MTGFANIRSFLRGYELPALPLPGASTSSSPSTSSTAADDARPRPGITDLAWVLLFLQGRQGLPAPASASGFLRPRPGSVEFVLDREGPAALFSVLERQLRAHPLAPEVGQFADAARLFGTIFARYPPARGEGGLRALLRDLLLVPAQLVEGVYFDRRAAEDETVRALRWVETSPERTTLAFASKFAALVPLLDPRQAASPGKRKRTLAAARVVPSVLTFDVGAPADGPEAPEGAGPERGPSLALVLDTVVGASDPVLGLEVVSPAVFRLEDALALHAVLLGGGLCLEAAGFSDPICADSLRVKLQASLKLADGAVHALLGVFARMLLRRRAAVLLTNWDVFMTLRLAPDGRVHVSPPFLRDRLGIPRHLPQQGPLELVCALQLVSRLNAERALRRAFDLKGGEEVEAWNYNGAHWFAIPDGKAALSVGHT